MTDGSITTHPPEAFTVRTLRLDETTQFVLTGELDLSNAPSLRDDLGEALRHGTRLIVDLRGLTFIDSSGIQALVETKRSCGQCGIEFAVRLDHDSQVKRMLLLAGVADFLGIS